MIHKKLLFLLLICVLFINSDCLNRKQDCKCKISPTDKQNDQTDFLSLIVGGTVANHLSHPWMVSINLRDDRMPSFLRKLVADESKLLYHSCGGILLNHDHVLTAAHCVPTDVKYMSVGYSNDNDLVQIFDNGRIKVKSYVVHPEWDPITIENDIAILKLERSIRFTSFTSPGCLQNTPMDHYPNNGLLITAGFGLTTQLIVDPLTGRSQPATVSRFLKELFLRDESSVTYRCIFDEKIICANSINKGESSCAGDSGSGLLSTFNDKSFVVGITSSTDQFTVKDEQFLVYCNGLTYYTRVASYIKFIESVVGDDYCPYTP